jgi:hypothetical protein
MYSFFTGKLKSKIIFHKRFFPNKIYLLKVKSESSLSTEDCYFSIEAINIHYMNLISNEFIFVEMINYEAFKKSKNFSC